MENVVLLSLSSNEFKNLIKETVLEAISNSKKIDKEKELLDSKGLCEWLNISNSTLNVWKRENKIPYKKMGKRVFFVRSEVMKALKDSNYYRLKEINNG